MRIKNCIGVSFYNLHARKRYTIRLFLNILLLFVVLVVWLVLSSAMENAHDEYIYGKAAQNTQHIPISVNKDGSFTENENYSLLKSTETWEEFDEPVLRGDVDLPVLLSKDNWLYVNIDYASAVISGNEHHGSNSYRPKEDESPAVASFRFSVVYSDLFITDDELTEFSYKNKNHPYLLAGSMQLRENEVLISDYMLSLFGVTEAPEQLIGQEISFLVDGSTVLEAYKISGIVDSRIFSDDTQIFIRGNTEITKRYNIQYVTGIIPIRTHSDALDALDKINEHVHMLTGENYYGPESAEVYANAAFYYNIECIHLVIERLVGLFGLMIFLAVILNLSNVLISAADTRRKQYGILKAVGMTPVSLLFISYVELFALSVIAMLVAVFTSFAMLKAIDGLMMTFINMHLSLSYVQYIEIGLIALLSMFVLLMLVEFFILRRKCFAQPTLLLHDEIK